MKNLLAGLQFVHAEGSRLFDTSGESYLDLYGGNGTITVGYRHPLYLSPVTEQLEKLPYGLTADLEKTLLDKLVFLSGYKNYQFYPCHSPAEARRIALDLLLPFAHVVGFYPKDSPQNDENLEMLFPLNDIEAFREYTAARETEAVIVKGIYFGKEIYTPENEFLQQLRQHCDEESINLIFDETMSGCGRSGKFFAHQHSGIRADMVIMGNMANGLPLAGILHSSDFHPRREVVFDDMISLSAGIALLEIAKREQLALFASKTGNYLRAFLSTLTGIRKVSGQGLWLSVETEASAAQLRNRLFTDHQIITGLSADNKALYLSPALNLPHHEVAYFAANFEKIMDSG